MSDHIRIVQNFNALTSAELVATGGAVSKGLTGSTLSANSPVDPKTIQAAVDDLAAAIAARPNAGLAGTAVKDNKRSALIAMLRKLAHYIQDNCGGDVAAVLNVGFSVVTFRNTSGPVENTTITGIDFGNTTQLVVKGKPVARARCYQLQKAAIGAGGTPGPWEIAGTFLSSRSMTVNGLTPGTTYLFQIRAYGGSTGYTDWSDSFSHVCL